MRTLNSEPGPGTSAGSERKAKLLRAYLNECLGLIKKEMWHVEAYDSTYGTVYVCRHHDYDWEDKVYTENAEGLLQEVGMPLSKRDHSMIAYLFLSHKEYKTFCDDRLIRYWVRIREVDLYRKYHWEIHQAEQKGHTLSYVRPFMGDTHFVTFRCFHQDIGPYFIHHDDGDVTVTRSSVWSNNDQSKKRYTFAELPSIETVVKIFAE